MSTIAVDNLKPSGGGTEFSTRGIAKAWVNFNGTGTVAIRDSENVSSVTDQSTGIATANFVNAMVSSDFTFCGGACEDYSNNAQDTRYISTQRTAPIVSAHLISAKNTSNTLQDMTTVVCNVHGDLA